MLILKFYVAKHFAVTKIPFTFVPEICGRDLSFPKSSEILTDSKV